MNRTLLALLIAVAPFVLSAQSRLNNHFILHVVADGSPSSAWVDSVASSHGFHSTYQTPQFGNSFSSAAQYCCNEYPPVSALVQIDSVMQKPRMAVLGFYNSWHNASWVDCAVYESGYSSALSWAYFQYMASECIEADYYEIRIPSADLIAEVLEILAQRPDWSNERWYLDLDGYSFVSEPCMSFGYASGSSSGTTYANEAVTRMAGFIENTCSTDWFPWILTASPEVQDWQYTSYGYALGQVMPNQSCDGDEYDAGEYWSCDTVVVACPDLDNNNVVGTGDLLEFLPMYGDSIDCSPDTPE